MFANPCRSQNQLVKNLNQPSDVIRPIHTDRVPCEPRREQSHTTHAPMRQQEMPRASAVHAVAQLTLRLIFWHRNHIDMSPWAHKVLELQAA
jgi:hypothetical protein